MDQHPVQKKVESIKHLIDASDGPIYLTGFLPHEFVQSMKVPG